MTIPKRMLMMVCLMCVPIVSKEAPKEAPTEAKVTPLFQKDLADLPGKEGVMIPDDDVHVVGRNTSQT
jgi:hypothetical protein